MRERGDKTQGCGETPANGVFTRFCRRLRDRAPSRDCLLVAVGDGSSLPQVEELLRAGADDYWSDVQDAARLDARLAVARRRAQRLMSAGERGDAAAKSFSACYPLAPTRRMACIAAASMAGSWRSIRRWSKCWAMTRPRS